MIFDENYELRTNYGVIFNNIVEYGINYILESDSQKEIRSLVIGLSGGIDSALTAVLARKICDVLKEKHDYKCELIGFVMPIESNEPDETKRGIDIGDRYCDVCKYVDLGSVYRYVRDNIEDEVVDVINADENTKFGIKVRNGNIKARVRMIQLYQAAHYRKGIVLSTDNLTELLLGFWTLHGDVGDLGLIQQLWKTEVYGLAKWLNTSDYGSQPLSRCIDAVPTDGLGVTKSDFDQLGVDNYEEIDKILIEYLKAEAGESSLSVDSGDISKWLKVTNRYMTTEFKRNNPSNISREELVCEPTLKITH